MSWGSFQCGLIAGAGVFGLIGLLFGWMIGIIQSNKSSDAVMLDKVLARLKRGTGFHLSLNVIDDDQDFRSNDDDDDDGDGDPSTSPSSYDWSRN